MNTPRHKEPSHRLEAFCTDVVSRNFRPADDARQESQSFLRRSACVENALSAQEPQQQRSRRRAVTPHPARAQVRCERFRPGDIAAQNTVGMGQKFAGSKSDAFVRSDASACSSTSRTETDAGSNGPADGSVWLAHKSDASVRASKHDPAVSHAHRVCAAISPGRKRFARTCARAGLRRHSSSPRSLLAAVPGAQRILDTCAAPGGKIAILAERHPQAEITAYDISAKRLQAMRRLFVPGRVHFEVADASAMKQPSGYDLILCDVPCRAPVLLDAI